MADHEHLKILFQGTTDWNNWREQNPDFHPDLSHANLNGVNLEGMNLSHADLRQTSLNQANLRRVNLESSILHGVNLDDALLYKANLRKASLRQALLRQTNLQKAMLEDANLAGANLTGAILDHANLRRCDLSSSNLMGAQLQATDMRRCQLISTNLREANLREADLRHANLQGAKLDRAILHLTLLTKTDLRDATLQQTDCSQANLQQAQLQKVNLEDAVFESADLRLANLENVQGQRAVFSNACLQKATLGGSNFEKANFSEASLRHADLTKTNFDKTELVRTNFSECSLVEGSLRNAQLIETNLEGSNLRYVNFSGALLDKANFQKADLRYASMQGASDFREATVAETSFGMANLTGANLPFSLQTFGEALKNVEYTSKHARTLHLWLMGICIFLLVTISAMTNTAFPSSGTTLVLPFVHIEVPSLLFFIGVPTIGLLLFCYFHFYLSHLYQSIAKLPANFPDGSSLRERLYPWMLNLCIHHWQYEAAYGSEVEKWPSVRVLQRQLTASESWAGKIIDACSALQMNERINRITSQIRTGIVVLISWGLLPVTLGALTYPLLMRDGSTLSYVLLGFLMIAGFVCTFSFETTFGTINYQQVDQRWVRPLTVTAVLILSGLLLANPQPLTVDSANVVQHIPSPPSLTP